MFNLLVCLFVLNSAFANGAPKTTAKPYILDQRQVGGSNIRLNLKDFNIIAIFNDDTSDNGQDYYDYELPSDYTDVAMPTTANSSLVNVSTTTTPTISIKPKPIVTSTTRAPSTPMIEVTSKKPTKTSTTTQPTTAKTTISTSTTPLTTVDQKPLVQNLNNTNGLKGNISSNDNTNSKGEDRIPVFVMQQYDSVKTPVSNGVTIVPEKNSSDKRPSTVGKIHFERCPQGFSRDKSGECRKFRRPPLYALSRLTSNLASTFRRPTEGILASSTANRQ